MEVTKSLNASVPEIIPPTKLQKYANNDLFVNVVYVIKSVDSALWMEEVVEEEPEVSTADDISNEDGCYLAALQNIGITKNNTE